MNWLMEFGAWGCLGKIHLYPSFFPLLLWGPCLSPWLFGQGSGCWYSIWCWRPSGCQQSAPNSWGKGCPPSSEQVLVVPPCTHNQFACGARGRSKRINPTPQGTAHLHWKNVLKHQFQFEKNIFNWSSLNISIYYIYIYVSPKCFSPYDAIFPCRYKTWQSTFWPNIQKYFLEGILLQVVAPGVDSFGNGSSTSSHATKCLRTSREMTLKPLSLFAFMVIRVALWKNHLLPVTLGSQFGDYLLTFGIPPQSPTSTRRPTKSMTPVIWGRLATSAQCLLLANPSIVTRMVPAPSNADALVDWERGMRHTILWDSWQVLLFHPNFFLWGLKETLYDIYIFFLLDFLFIIYIYI